MACLVDFHSHILPQVDDGARSVDESLAMLKLCAEQGISDVCLTPHFYAYDDTPDAFCRRREEAFSILQKAIAFYGIPSPRLHMGAEVAYFPGMSESRELVSMAIGTTKMLLIELPMEKVSSYMLDEVESVSKTLGCIPVLAHLDRHIKVDGFFAVMSKVKDRRILFQFNASFFISAEWAEKAMNLLTTGMVHFIGSDCHGISWRPPNMVKAVKGIINAGHSDRLDKINRVAVSLLNPDS